MPSIALYIVGFIVLIIGMAMAANLLGIPQTWIIVGVVIVAGIVILALASNIEGRNPPRT
jgi:hypothetical protein